MPRQNRNFDIFSKILEKIYESVCFLVMLMIVDHTFKNKLLHRKVFRNLFKILVTLSEIRWTLIKQNNSSWLHQKHVQSKILKREPLVTISSCHFRQVSAHYLMSILMYANKGIPLRCELFRKRIDQKNFLLWQQLTKYTVLETHFWYVNYTLVARIWKKFEQSKPC